jgi:ABC-2 type transport system ATP-binding protein
VSASATPAPAASAVSLDGVSVFYGEVVGLSRVTLELGPGITGIVGPNGSGKSTMMRVLTGLVPPREGSVQVLGGEPFTDHHVRERIAFVPATECYYDGLSARRNLEIAFLARGLDRGQARSEAARALELVKLAEHGDRRYGTWSRGMRQRLKLALALAIEAELVLLDEPFLGVDPPSRRALREIILALEAGGRTVLVSSHVLHEVESLTDRVGVLASGRLLGFGPVHRLLQDLRDRHPHRVHLVADQPRRLASALLECDHVLELRLIGGDRLEFVTERPDTAYRELAGLVVKTGVVVRTVETLDNTLEAVFTHVTEAGARRL